MNHNKITLPIFLSVNNSTIGVFDGFDFKSFIDKFIDKHCPICSICLSFCKVPSIPDRCTHYFCYYCIKNWSRIKKSCPMCRINFNNIIKC